MEDWLIVRTKPKAELLACGEIAALGQTVYLPSFRREFHHRRMRKWITHHYPLWTGYALVMASERWPLLMQCPHVTYVLRSGGIPIPVRDEDVRAIRDAQENGEFDLLRVDVEKLRPGDKVRIKSGPFTGHHAKVEKVDDTNVVFLIEAMGREMRAITNARPAKSTAQVTKVQPQRVIRQGEYA